MTDGKATVRFALVTLLVLGTSGPVPADEPADEKARAAEFATLAQHEAESYAFRSDTAGAVFRLRSEPVLRWSNPVVGSIYGNVYVGTDRGRPEVVASIHKWYSPFKHRSHEFVSLSRGTLTMERDGEPVWTAAGPGVVLEPLPEAPAPAGTPAQRLRQMRALVNEFTARETDRQDIDRDLRLLSQPVFRYEAAEADLIDGALFAFVLGTDPEAVLVLEARQSDGRPRWQYALARLNSVHLRVSYHGNEVWNVPTLSFREVYAHRGSYTSFKFDPEEAATKPEGR